MERWKGSQYRVETNGAEFSGFCPVCLILSFFGIESPTRPVYPLQTVVKRRYLGHVLWALMYRYVSLQAGACLQSDIKVLRRRNSIPKREKIFTGTVTKL